MDMSDFDGMDSLSNNVMAPPNKVKAIKPSKEDLYAYYHNGLQPPKPLAKRYSMEHIRWVLEELYHYKLVDITEYKGTRGYDNHKRYRIEDENGKSFQICANRKSDNFLVELEIAFDNCEIGMIDEAEGE